jgi:hypothetical protein
MEKLKGIKIQYLHPASPPLEIRMDTIYTIGLDGKKLYIDNGDQKIEIRYEVLVQLFQPVDGSWDELLKEEVKEEIKLDKK